MKKILLIEDEPSLRNILKINLEAHGFAVAESATGGEGIAALREHRPHLIILDLGLPDRSGVNVLKEIRAWSGVPIVILTVRDEEAVKVDLLEAGADDYMTKPFSIPELLARVRVCLRHHPEGGAAAPVFTSGDLTVDLVDYKVMVGEREVRLTVTEFGFLRVLIKHHGRIVAQETILSEVWGPTALSNPHYLRIYVRQLRKKLEVDPAQPRHILTEPGFGYRIV